MNESNDNTLQITNEVLDELVCGSLPPARYRAVLKQLEREPSKWRDCALAFLVEQVMEAEMKDLASSDIQWSPSSAAEQVAKASTTAPPIAESASSTQPPQPLTVASQLTARQQSTARLLRLQRYTSLAAMVLVAFTIGWIGSGMRDSGPVSNEQASSPTSAGLATTGQPRNGFEQVNPPETGSDWSQGMRFASEGYVPLDLEIPEKLRSMEKRGLIRIEIQSGLFPVELEDGTSAIFPMQLYRAVPVVHSY